MSTGLGIAAVAMVLAAYGCAAKPESEPRPQAVPLGTLEVGAFRVATEHETGDLEAALAALFTLRDPSKTIIIYDASGSMRWPMALGSPSPRFEPGQAGISAYLRRANGRDYFGLIVFGHRLPSGRRGSASRERSCGDIEVVVPLARLDREKMIDTITRLRLRDHIGDTPLERSMRLGVDVLRNEPGRKMLVMVTDGDDECDGRPDVAAKEAAEHDIRVHAIAFGIGIGRDGTRDPERADEIRRMLIDAVNAGAGTFLEARDAEELHWALLRVELAMFTYSVRDEAGNDVATGRVGQRIALAPGTYRIVLDTDVPFSDSVSIESGRQTRVFIVLAPSGAPEVRKVLE